jgi:hypothetical protein
LLFGLKINGYRQSVIKIFTAVIAFYIAPFTRYSYSAGGGSGYAPWYDRSYFQTSRSAPGASAPTPRTMMAAAAAATTTQSPTTTTTPLPTSTTTTTTYRPTRPYYVNERQSR